MKLVRLAAGCLTAGVMAQASAATVFEEGFDSVSALNAAGWVFTNASAPIGASWFQGNEGIFAAQAGAAGAYAGVNFNSSSGIEGLVDNWLITPEIAVGAGSTLTFYTRAADAGFFDLLEVRFSSGAGTATTGFSTLLGTIGEAGVAAYPLGAWTAVTLTLPTATSGRIAFRYTVPNALDASYIGIDSVSVSAVPEPAALSLFALGLAAVGVARRRSVSQ